MDRKLAMLAGATVVVLGLLGAWRWGLRADDDVVPSCSDLAGALPSAVQGSWTLTRTEPNREVSDYLVRCEFAFRSADQAYWGTVMVSLSADDDEASLRKRATDGPCYGEAVPNPSAAKYSVARSCSEQINDKIFASVFVASDRRYGHSRVEFSSSSQSLEQVAAYARTSAQHLTDLAMSLEAGE
ncbi:hypothetical protein ACFOOK_02575 [Micromonospora krabiensis]|uniref:Uncharacterized protein n=1 Tax=Micromonospora krabiensis TaxID=307121 RepID=A0A1C3MWQ4_9ACTN|nr:hypothetical protein [Micromonospora krabiensis]SBV24756.1 hypothetical protein GA0070620_0195 [Micromonospora krabiensis]